MLEAKWGGIFYFTIWQDVVLWSLYRFMIG